MLLAFFFFFFLQKNGADVKCGSRNIEIAFSIIIYIVIILCLFNMIVSRRYYCWCNVGGTHYVYFCFFGDVTALKTVKMYARIFTSAFDSQSYFRNIELFAI